MGIKGVRSMTCEEYYGAEYERLLCTEALLVSKIGQIKNEARGEEDLQPIVYCCSRIKSPESMIDKLRRYGLPATLEAALGSIYDAVGVRIVCSFTSDVINVVERLENDPELTVIEKKDYLTHPKPNGYRSVHLCVRLIGTGVLAEIQIRTIAMDFWATLEHQLKYKKRIAHDQLFRSELKRCADEIASVDISMQTIREILNDI